MMNMQFRKNITICCFTFVLLSSSSWFAFAMEVNDLNSYLVQFDNNDKLENEIIQQPQMPTEKVLYNIKIPRGVSERTFLSCDKNGKVDMYDKDDQEGRQKWRFINLYQDVYRIEVSNPEGNRKYLSCTNGGVVDLYDKDDNSGRQQWKLIKKPNGSFNINSIGIKGNRKYLSCTNGGVVDLYDKDDNSGRQQWVLSPEDLEIIDITFNINNPTRIPQPDFIIETLVANDTDLPQKMTATFGKVAKNTSSFKREHGFSFGVSATQEWGLPTVAQGSVTVTASTQHKWTEGRTQESEDTRTYTFPVVVPARSTVTAKATVSQLKLDVPYTVKGKSKITGETIISTGTWQGISLGKISYSLSQQ
jgi:hypothetical protein